jgi:hypothetical protein
MPKLRLGRGIGHGGAGASVPELVRGRPVVAHNNLFGDVRNMGTVYTGHDVVVDGDCVTVRSGPLCHLFAPTIINVLVEKFLGYCSWNPRLRSWWGILSPDRVIKSRCPLISVGRTCRYGGRGIGILSQVLTGLRRTGT